MRKVLVLAVAVVGLLAAASPASAVLIDDFNGENGGTGALNYAGFANWDVGGGTVDLIGNGYFDFYPGNGLYVDLDGSTFNAGILSLKPFNQFLAAGSYTLQFYLGGSQRGDADNTVKVIVGGVEQTFVRASGAPLALETIAFAMAADGYLSLSFENTINGNDNIGLILDNVSVEAVPEPGTLLLIGTGLTGLALRRRRRA